MNENKETLRKKIGELEKSVAHYKNLSLLKNDILESPESIIVFALDKRYRYLDFTSTHKQTMKEIWNGNIKVGNNMLDYIKSDNDRKKARINFDRALKGGRFVLYEEYGDEKLKRTYYENRYSPIYDKNKRQVTGVAVYVIDITYQKEIELKLNQQVVEFTALNNNYKRLNDELAENYRNLEQINIELNTAKEEAEKGDRLKSAFLHNMSHEIRTPMNAILGFSDLLKTPQFTPQQYEEYLSDIQESGKRILETVDNLLEMSMIESGLVQLSYSEIEIRQQINALFSIFEPEAAKKGLRMLLGNNTPKEKVTLTTDKEKLSTILTHLIKNSIKFTNKGVIEIGYSLLADNLRFYVKDTGTGIPKGKADTVFDRFVKANIENTKHYGGNGLGLSISKAYVEMLGGKIWVKSNEGTGSIFYFTLPFAAKHVKDNKNQLLKAPPKNLKILIVDEEYTPASLLNLTLQEVAKTILHAETGAKAIEICRQNPDIDLILIDMELQDMTGPAIIRKIRSIHNEVIIIGQTDVRFRKNRATTSEDGFNDIIYKPFQQEELLQLIESRFKF